MQGRRNSLCRRLRPAIQLKVWRYLKQTAVPRLLHPTRACVEKVEVEVARTQNALPLRIRWQDSMYMLDQLYLFAICYSYS